MTVIRVGTRGSKLALAQTSIVTERMKSLFADATIEVIRVKTSGDILPPKKRGPIEGKTAFTDEIEEQLSKGKLDLAVHSMKDLPLELYEGCTIGATAVRGDPRDALISATGKKLSELPPGAKLGTSSQRRKTQLLRLRYDLDMIEITGNVDTRIKKITDLSIDGIVLAAAGLERLGEQGRIAQIFDTEEIVPAVGQGIIAVECRKDDARVARLLSCIENQSVRAAAECERAFAAKLGSDCHAPLGAYAERTNDTLRVVGMIASPDGTEFLKKEVTGPPSSPAEVGQKLAKVMFEHGGRRILDGVAA